MSHRSRRRSTFDPLAPTFEATWLVVEDAWGRALKVTPLAPYADLRAVLNAAREDHIADGWDAQPIGRCAHFFCAKNGQRLLVGINRRDPTLPREVRGKTVP